MDNTKQTSTESVNGEKTEAILIGTKQESLFISMNILQLDYITVPLSDSVKMFGVLLDSTLSMINLINQISKSYNYQLRQISSVQKYLSTEDTVKLVTSLIPSHCDNYSSLLSGLPAFSVQFSAHSELWCCEI